MLMISSIIASHLAEPKEALLDPDNALSDTKYRLQAIVLMILKYNEYVTNTSPGPSISLALKTFIFRNVRKLSKCVNKIYFAQISMAWIYLILGVFRGVTVIEIFKI